MDSEGSGCFHVGRARSGARIENGPETRYGLAPEEGLVDPVYLVAKFPAQRFGDFGRNLGRFRLGIRFGPLQPTIEQFLIKRAWVILVDPAEQISFAARQGTVNIGKLATDRR